MKQLDQTGQADAPDRKRPATDSTAFLTPHQLAGRWGHHPESIRRMLRQRRIASVLFGRRRLIPLAEVHRIEAGGFVSATP